MLILSVLTGLSVFGNCPDKNIQLAVENGSREALESLALELTDCPQWADSLGMVYHKLGVMAFVAGDMEAAVGHMRQAVDSRNKAFGGGAHEDLGRSYFNLGYFYELEEDYRKALPCFQASADIQRALDNRVLYEASTLRVAVMYLMAGDYNKAERLLKWLVEEGEELNRVKAQLNLGLLYTEQSSSEQALSQLSAALPYFSANGPVADEAATLLNLANAHYHLQQPEQALRYGKQALEAYTSLEDTEHQSKAGNLLGLTYMKLEEYERAAEYLSSALAWSRSAGSKEIEASTMDNLGELALQKGDAAAAEDWFLKAIHSLKPGFSPDGALSETEQKYLGSTPYQVDLFIYLNDLLKSRMVQYDQSDDAGFLQAAQQWLYAGDYLIDQMRKTHSDEGTKLFWREEALPFYESAVRVCSGRGDTQAAFYFLEKSQSVLLLEALSYADALSAIPDSLRVKELGLRRQLNRLQLQLERSATGEDAATLEQIIEVEQQLAALMDYLRKAYTVYQKQSQAAEVVSLSSVQAGYLKNEELALLQYLFGQDRVFLLYATGEDARFIDLGSRAAVEKQVTSFLEWFAEPALIERSPEAYKASAYALFRQLVPIEIGSGVSRLLIVPGGPLAYLPFEALLTEEQRGTDLSTAPYVVQEYDLTYAFSATLFDQLERRPSPPVADCYALAPFASREGPQHPMLKFSSDELQAIGTHFPVQAFYDSDADRQAFRAATARAGILHLSTHAFGAYDGQLPYIALADSSVFLTDLYQWEIPAELVVLSACQSNVGRLAQGEGVLGLGRGFFYSGTRSVVASLWNLNDQSTSQLIGSFYESLADEQPKGQALQMAKQQYLSDPKVPAFRKSPYYWAGLIYYGDSTPLSLEGGYSNWWLLLPVAGLLGLFLFWRRTA